MSPLPPSQLVDLPDGALWTSRAWTDFAQLPARRRGATVVVLPLFGLADWGLGRPLDLEEQIGTAVLRHAVETPGKRGAEMLVLPPVRFVLGPYVHTLFGIDFETALDLTLEIAASVKAAGFRRLMLFTTSPWNEELIDVAGRSIRVRLGMHAFQVPLGALGLDLHPLRGGDRSAVQSAACACSRRPPDDTAPAPEVIALREFRPGKVEQPGPVPLTLPFEDAWREGERLLAAAGQSLRTLCGEMARKAALPNDGRIASRRAPEPPRAGHPGGKSRRK